MFIILLGTICGFLLGLFIVARNRGVGVPQALSVLAALTLSGVLKKFLFQSKQWHNKHRY